jgi:hypothetical protein
MRLPAHARLREQQLNPPGALTMSSRTATGDPGIPAKDKTEA